MIPEFGKKLKNEFKTRKASYAVILQNGKVAIVWDSNRNCFLPVGGKQNGERTEENIQREIIEECGRKAEINKYIGEAIQYFISSSGEYYKMNSHFFYCSFVSGLGSLSRMVETPRLQAKKRLLLSHYATLQAWSTY